ncbi:hypothetical protein C0Q70_11972 [Pomacea canaliculata]|uniref:Uncharacterized protein n=1 Tax=Pomacea canaliculata TaxID=400727 RepID=A0A2T7P091_POMCA|nr:hypothetical protein C0Q70_11972 [Pomacea canaliculata]
MSINRFNGKDADYEQLILTSTLTISQRCIEWGDSSKANRDRKDKERVIKARCRLKESGIVISEDLTHLNIQRLNRLKQQEGVVDAWSAAGGRLFAKLRDSSVVEIKSEDTSPIHSWKLIELHNEQRSQHQRRSEGNPQRFPQDTLQRQHVHRPQIHQQPTHKEKAHRGLSTPPSQLSRSSHSTPTTPTSAAEAVSPQPCQQSRIGEMKAADKLMFSPVTPLSPKHLFHLLLTKRKLARKESGKNTEYC